MFYRRHISWGTHIFVSYLNYILKLFSSIFNPICLKNRDQNIMRTIVSGLRSVKTVHRVSSITIKEWY